MKISEILELTQIKPINEIAKEHLSIGEKPARRALKNAGCYSLPGKKGWYCDNPEILEKSIYEFSTVRVPTANVTTNKQKNVRINTPKNIKTNEQKDLRTNELESVATTEPISEIPNEQKNIPENERKNVTTNETINVDPDERKRASYDIRASLTKRLKVKAVLEDRNLYELVEEAIEEYLNK